MKCKDCCHAEMCKWIDELEGRGCDFGEPCEDAISRKWLLELVEEEIPFTDIGDRGRVRDTIKHLPSVTPKLTECEDAISRETIEDIKAEIYKERTNISFNLSEEKSKWVNSGIYDGLVWAEEIIDKHIKESSDADSD